MGEGEKSAPPFPKKGDRLKDTELARLPPILLITRKHKMPLVRGHSKRLIEELYTCPDNPEVEISSPCCRPFFRMPNVRTACHCQNLEICPHYCANENNLRYFQAFRNPNEITHGCMQMVRLLSETIPQRISC